jgi:hypothetical protein
MTAIEAKTMQRNFNPFAYLQPWLDCVDIFVAAAANRGEGHMYFNFSQFNFSELTVANHNLLVATLERRGFAVSYCGGDDPDDTRFPVQYRGEGWYKIAWSSSISET